MTVCAHTPPPEDEIGDVVSVEEPGEGGDDRAVVWIMTAQSPHDLLPLKPKKEAVEGTD